MLSILMLILTLCVGVYYVVIFLFPAIGFESFEAQSVDPNAPPTATLTPIQLDATWTVTPTAGCH